MRIEPLKFYQIWKICALNNTVIHARVLCNLSPTHLTLFNFCSSDDSRQKYPIDLGKYPVQIPIPLTEAEKLGLSVIPQKLKPNPINIGTQNTAQTKFGGKLRLSAPGVIKEVFGAPKNLSDMRASIPDFTSSGPVNIPSPLQLYGNIEQYLNTTTTTERHSSVHFDT